MKKWMVLSLLTCLCAQAVIAQTKTNKILRHVVLFKFKDGATPANIKSVENAFLLLPSKIKSIKDFEWGTNNSPEKLNEGLTHCFVGSFASEKDRDDYLVHPDHKAFVDILLPFLEKAVVLDYWVKK